MPATIYAAVMVEVQKVYQEDFTGTAAETPGVPSDVWTCVGSGNRYAPLRDCTLTFVTFLLERTENNKLNVHRIKSHENETKLW